MKKIWKIIKKNALKWYSIQAVIIIAFALLMFIFYWIKEGINF